MSRLRIGVIVFLFLAPWLFLVVAGCKYLSEQGWWLYASWPMFLSMALAYVLAWRWTRKGELPPTDVAAPNYWTDRDKQAWEKVKAKAASYEKITTTELTDPKHYSDLALDLATQVAQSYNPEITSVGTAFDHLTLPEILACAELAAADLNAMVERYVPGSHMLRIRDAKRARKAADWYRTGQNLYWAGAAILNPLQAIPRYIASRTALGSLFERIQNNVILWFHTAFVHQFGHYLVELNSGRLRVGVKRYRELTAAHAEPPKDEPPPPADTAAAPPTEAALAPAADGPPTPPAAIPPPPIKPVVIAVLGPVKAGKSSLVNALLGRAAATVDTLPVPHIGVEYAFTLPGGQAVRILDTAGYGQDGPNEAEFEAAAEAARQSDLILLVTAANNPGRGPEVGLLDRLRTWFAGHPQLKLPPVVAVVNQVDLLSPKAEWSPPYTWQTGTRPKEVNIRECVGVVKEQFGDRVAGVVPTCARQGETLGIGDGVVPAIALHLDDARGAAILKAFDAEGSAGQYGRLGQQLLEGGRKALGILWDSLKK